jgi:twitching motility protein PilT
MAFSAENFKTLMQLGVKHKASDIHLRTGEPPAFRVRGTLKSVESKPLTIEDMKNIAKLIIHDKEVAERLGKIQEYDGGFTLEGICRIRYNLFRYRQGRLGIIFRLIKTEIPTVESLGLSPTITKIAEARRGLVLVTGATGAGKSTTLAAIINHINHNRGAHIITLEDPIEYVYESQKARISQREIGVDSDNFVSALRGALRQDPDVILIGELRDPETMGIALKAAETGHMVYATVHTTNALQTITRLVSMFPPEEQKEIRKRLSEALYATISQRLLKGVQKDKLYVAQEIMVNNPGIKECIDGSESLEKINYFISKHADQNRGSEDNQSFDDHILELFKEGKISKKTAYESVESQVDFVKKLSFE